MACKDGQHDFVIRSGVTPDKKVGMYYACTRCGMRKVRTGVTNLTGSLTCPHRKKSQS